MNYNLISSKEIIGRVFNTYNIKSAGFIGKVPQWLGEALGQMKIYVALQPTVTKVEISNYRGKLPNGLKSIEAVLYNNRILPRVQGKRLHNPNMNIFDSTYIRDTTQEITYDDDGNIVSIDTTMDNVVSVSSDIDTNNNYILKPGYIDTSFESGIIYIYFLRYPEETDPDTGMYLPLVPEGEFCQTACVWYILQNILYSGYKHPILSLNTNNRYLNPSMQWEYYYPMARNESLRRDKEQMEIHSRLWQTVVLDADNFAHSFHPKYEL